MSAKQRRRLSVAQWREVLDRFEPGTQTVASFCAREGVCVASFHRWRARLAGQAAGASHGGRKAVAPSPVPHRSAGFVEIGPLTPTPPPDPTRTPAGLLLRLDLGGGLVLQISRP